MKTIQRYDCDERGMHLAGEANGQYVLYTDHARELAALREALAGVHLDIHNQRTGHGDTQFLRMADKRIRAALNQGKAE